MKKYRCTLLIDENLLKQTYKENQDTLPKECPPFTEMIRAELAWVLESGIDIEGNLEELTENKTSISIEWGIEDIQIEWGIEDIQGVVANEYEKSISNEDAVIVLEYLEDNYDPSHGITWTVIQAAIDNLTNDNSIFLLNLDQK